jgi:hypothetical protein
MTLVAGSAQVIPTGRNGYGMELYLKQAAYNCDQCHRLSIALAHSSREVYGTEVLTFFEDDKNFSNWLPVRIEAQDFPDVPEHIAVAATEATKCLSVSAYRAVGSLARAVIEATAKDKGAEGKDLFQRIEALANAEHIRGHTKEQAHEVRHFGNGMAHGDFTDPVTEEEADEVIELMCEILDEVYQSPARLQRVREARQAKKTARAGGVADAAAGPTVTI